MHIWACFYVGFIFYYNMTENTIPDWRTFSFRALKVLPHCFPNSWCLWEIWSHCASQFTSWKFFLSLEACRSLLCPIVLKCHKDVLWVSHLFCGTLQGPFKSEDPCPSFLDIFLVYFLDCFFPFCVFFSIGMPFSGCSGLVF